MSITYGVTPQGFVSKSADTIKTELEADLKAGPLGASAGTEPDGSIPVRSVAGQLVAMLVDGFAAMWDLLEAVYASFDPAQNTDDAQDAVCAITGTTRNRAIKSTDVVTCTGTPGTVLTTGRVVRVVVSGTRFVSLGPGTIASVAAWAQNTGYTVGQRVTANSRVYQCITSGTSSNSGTGPSTTAADITDGTVHWRFLGAGTGAVDVNYQAEVAGPFAALSGTLTDIATPVAGWQGAINLLDATVGATLEGNTPLRLRRESEIKAAGNTTADGIKARLLQLGQGTTLPVTACTVFQNEDIVPNGDGLPAKSVEVLVERATSDPDPAIALAVFNAVAAGIQTFGTVNTTIQDSAGNTQPVAYSRPTPVPIWIRLDITYDPLTFPTDTAAGAASIKAAVALFGGSYVTGLDVRSQVIAAAAEFAPVTAGGSPVQGILEVTLCYIGLVNPPVSPATIPITKRQRATFDTARITVNLTPGTP